MVVVMTSVSGPSPTSSQIGTSTLTAGRSCSNLCLIRVQLRSCALLPELSKTHP
jgi:hypothetical protein